MNLLTVHIYFYNVLLEKVHWVKIRAFKRPRKPFWNRTCSVRMCVRNVPFEHGSHFLFQYLQSGGKHKLLSHIDKCCLQLFSL